MVKTESDLPEEYQTGRAIFLGCKIDLSMRVLIPRPETEFWTAAAIKDLENLKKENLRILDIFSGSGCIGVAAAKKLPSANVDLSDIDSRAVRQIKINLEINDINKNRVNIFKSDIFNDIPAGNSYDAILANPPYIDPARIGEVQRSVLDYEPRVALFSGGGGTDTIDKFLKEAKNFLKVRGFIYMEFDKSQANAIKKMVEAGGYSSAEFFNDQFGELRFVKIIKWKK